MIARIFTYYILSSVSSFFFFFRSLLLSFLLPVSVLLGPVCWQQDCLFSSSENVLVSPLIPKDIFAGYKILFFSALEKQCASAFHDFLRINPLSFKILFPCR